ncbi:hypothetical protein BE21_37345, partial [Sorangium cellulosum]
MESATAKFDLTLSLQETEAGVQGHLEYATDLFDAATVARMSGHLRTLLEGIVADPHRRLGALPLLTPEERHELLCVWNRTDVEYPKGRCIHELFEAQVEAAPEAVAVVFEGQQVSYQELNRRADRLAHHLRSLGVGPGVLVGLCIERSIEMVLGMLGILKAGGAYVPLDPAYPKARLAFMMVDAAAPVLITRQALLSRLPAQAPSVLLLDALEADRVDGAADHNSNPVATTGPEHPAYVIYTSGSTGQPKGVVVTHASLCNLASWHRRRFEVTAEDRIAQLASFSFDSSVSEVWPCLAAGAHLHIVPDEVRSEPERLARWLCDEEIGIAFAPTPLGELLLEQPWPSRTKLRALRVGGAPLKRRPSPESPFEVINEYGPTEGTVVATTHRVASDEAGVIPIGRPIANVRVYVLNDALQPQPIGVPGELYLGGLGLSRGYLSRPELSAERFIERPFEEEPGARLYRTGDWCRFKADGVLEYVGRMDQQVKVRGFRIELGEIEAVLGQHPAVQQAVVMAREDTPSDRRLVAYVVAREGTSQLASELRDHLGERLPEHMVPSAFVPLAALPLSPNGKIDERALPAPGGARPEQKNAFVAPSTPAEQVLAGAFGQVLDLSRVSVHDNFFSLGGDSILAIQVVSKARQAGLYVSVRQLFQHQTIAELSAVATLAPSSLAEQGAVAGPVVLTPIQRWFFEQAWPEPHHFNQTILLEVRQALDPVLLERALQHLVSHHDALRMRFVREGEGICQAHAGLAGSVELTTVDLSTVPAEQQARAVEATSAGVQTRLRLDEGPLLSGALMDLGPGRPGRLAIAIHHLVVDGVSWRILLEDLETAYVQLAHGEPARMPLKTTSFQRWAERIAAHALSGPVREELPFWLATPAARPLPVDIEGGEDTVASAATVVVALEADETRALLQDVPEVYRTQINDVLLTALGQAFAPWTREHVLRFDLEGHGREELFPDLVLSRTVGWFTALFPVALSLPPASPAEALKAVKEQLRRIPQHGIGYGLLRYLHPDPAIAAELAAQAPSEVSFNYLGQLDAGVSASSLFGWAEEPSGPAQSPRARRTYRLEIKAWVAGGRLEVGWTYSENLYRRPTIERLAERFLAALRALLSHCLSPEAGGRTPSDYPLARLSQAAVDALAGRGRDVEDIYPLSPLQQGLLYHTLRDPASGVYVEQLTFRIASGLDVEALRASWQQVLERHPILRTSFAWEGLDEPVQVVRTGVTLPWAEHDLRGMSSSDLETWLENFLAEDRDRGFDLARAPLMRCALLRRTDEAYQLVLSHHHLLLDGWSMPLLFGELFAYYEAACRREAIRLPSPRPYRDYIAWLGQQDLGRAEAFWRKALAGFDEPTPLPAGRRNGAAAPALSQAVERRLSAAVTEALDQVARAGALTLSTLVEGAWAILLSRYCDRDDVVFGATVSGRSAGPERVDAMVGLFINTLPRRVRLSQDAPLGAWLKQLQEQQAEQLSYDYSPLASVQGWSEIPRGQALFQTLLVVENYPVDAAIEQAEHWLPVEDVRVLEQTNYPLTVVVAPGPELVLRLLYAA